MVQKNKSKKKDPPPKDFRTGKFPTLWMTGFARTPTIERAPAEAALPPREHEAGACGKAGGNDRARTPRASCAGRANPPPPKDPPRKRGGAGGSPRQYHYKNTLSRPRVKSFYRKRR